MRQWRSSSSLRSLSTSFELSRSLDRAAQDMKARQGKQKLEFLDIFVGVSVFSTAGHGFVV